MSKAARDKGQRGERLFRDLLREEGYASADRNAQQYKGGSHQCPDVLCDELSALHFEVKFVESLNVRSAVDQATRDAGPHKLPIVAHKTSAKPWLVTLSATHFFRILREGVTAPRIHGHADAVSTLTHE